MYRFQTQMWKPWLGLGMHENGRIATDHKTLTNQRFVIENIKGFFRLANLTFMYVGMHACMHACMHVCMYVCTYLHERGIQMHERGIINANQLESQ